MAKLVQIKRTATPNSPPNGLLPGELSVEMAEPLRLWVGVPVALDPAGMKLLIPALVGACVDFPCTAPPAGFIKRNGALLNRAAYPALWAFAQASGNLVASDAAWTGNEGAFSPGDGATTFRIPDARGMFHRAWDDGRGIDAGRVMGANQAQLVASHVHEFLGILHTTPTGGTTVGVLRTSNGASVGAQMVTTNNNLGGGAENRPRNLAMLACIKY